MRRWCWRRWPASRRLLGSYNKLERSTSYVHKDGSSSSWKVDRMDLVFLPARRHLRLWWTMAGGR